ncbi:probable ATP-dependent RNA helicase ddx56 [Papaver somniferum]|uniref:probable ATP-dependent RNA helicase ddx56 n=1 Tax=Papaver somniferum TaxID=3469 RepID=UPI000E6FE5E9|nr:probable ATP-dependent RNA helicase ddx56 [Papaver somniferum]
MLVGKAKQRIFHLSRLRSNFMGTKKLSTDGKEVTPQRIIATANAYVLYILGVVILPDVPGARVNANFIQLLQPFGKIQDYSWGTAILDHSFTDEDDEHTEVGRSGDEEDADEEDEKKGADSEDEEDQDKGDDGEEEENEKGVDGKDGEDEEENDEYVEIDDNNNEKDDEHEDTDGDDGKNENQSGKTIESETANKLSTVAWDVTELDERRYSY